MTSQNSKPSSPKRLLWIGLVVLLLAAGTIAALELTNTTYIFHKQHYVTGGPATKGQSPNSSQQSSNQGSQSSPTNNATSDGSTTKNPSPNTSTATLIAPTGVFISAHHLSLSVNPQINSVCNTTPGATCEILFTQGSVTKSLPAQTTDQGGATYWNGWRIKDIGITTGTWKVSAKAMLGSQITTASDATDLEVSE